MATVTIGVPSDSADDLVGRSVWVVEGRVVPLDEEGRPQVLRILVLKPLELRSRENERHFL